MVIVGSEDGTVTVSDLATGEPAADPFTGHTDAVNSVTTAELDGRLVVISGGADGTLRVWDPAVGEPAADPFTGHTDAVNSVTTAELDGRLVVISGGADSTLRTWDLVSGQPISQMPMDADVSSVATADLRGQTIVISGSPGTVEVWDLTTRPHRPPLHRCQHCQLNNGWGARRWPVVIVGCDDGVVRSGSGSQQSGLPHNEGPYWPGAIGDDRRPGRPTSGCLGGR